MEKRRWGAWLMGAGMFLAYFVALLAILHAVGTDDALYLREQAKAGVLEYAGISREELIGLDGDLAAYLAGDASALDGTPFNEKERTHMADCYALFVLLRRVLWICAVAAAALLLIAALVCRYRNFARAALLGALAFVGAILLLGIWGAVDFDSLFTAFHHLLFTNDLWLLDPRTDLLIRICPQSMFVTMALRIGGLELGFIALVNLILRAGPAFLRRYK